MANLNLTINRGTTFGPIRIFGYSVVDGVRVYPPLAGYKAYAQTRKGPGGDIVIDFSPVIEDDDEDGLITLPAIPHELTKDIPSCSIPWDLILEAPDGTIATEPLVRGRVSINQTISRKI